MILRAANNNNGFPSSAGKFVSICHKAGTKYTDLSDSGFIVCQTQQEDAGLVDLDGHRPPSPLHLAHGGCLLGSCLSDQRLRTKCKKIT